MFTSTPTPIRPQGRSLPSADAWLLWSVETAPDQQQLSIAELADCACPDLCDRDHANE